MVLFYIEECAGRPQPASLLPGAASISRRGSLWGSPPRNSPHNFLGSLWGGDSLADRRTLPSPFPLAKLLERTLERPGKELDPVSSNLVCLPSLLPEPTRRKLWREEMKLSSWFKSCTSSPNAASAHHPIFPCWMLESYLNETAWFSTQFIVSP